MLLGHAVTQPWEHGGCNLLLQHARRVAIEETQSARGSGRTKAHEGRRRARLLPILRPLALHSRKEAL